jgi:enoyl-CoA hydratase/carnithine racemase
MYETLSFEVLDQVARVGLNRPDKRNAFNLQMLRELALAFTTCHRDPDVRCVLLFAHGSHFTGGLDLAEVGPAVREGAPLFPPDCVDPLGIHGPRLSKPLIVAVQGTCLTIGVELLLASDIRLASVDARFAQMEVQRGILPFGGGTWRWPAAVGWGHAMRWLLTGETFAATEALRMGLVQELAEGPELLGKALLIAARVAAQAPLAVQATLRSARLATEEGPASASIAILGEARSLMESDDAREGLRSFLERRPAVFSGR